jgi:peroxiredoxin
MDSKILHNLEAEQRAEPTIEQRGITGREIVYGVLGLLAGLLVLSGVWLAANRTDASSDFPQVSEVNRPAPDFELQTLDGQVAKLSDYRGKIVLINFWGTWCEPCKAETPALEQAYSELKDDDFVILGVNLLFQERAQYKRDVDAVQQFITLYGVSYPITLDKDGSVSQSYAIAPIPTSYVIDQQGNMRFIRVGGLTSANVKAMVEKLKKEASATSQTQ